MGRFNRAWVPVAIFAVLCVALPISACGDAGTPDTPEIQDAGVDGFEMDADAAGPTDAAHLDVLGDTDTDADATPAAIFPETLSQTLGAALTEHFETTVAAPGVAIAVVLSDGARWERGLGWATTESDEAGGVAKVATPAHSFQMGSITKTFTAAAIISLRDAGLLDLDASLDSVVDGFNLGPDVTLRALLTHSSGIFNLTDDIGFLAKSVDFWLPGDIINWAMEHPAEFAPQTGYKYSNTGFLLLGMVIEAVTGRPYHTVIRERLLDPAGLTRVYLDQFEAGPSEPGPQAAGYLSGVNVVPNAKADMSWAWAAGAMAGTVGDLCRWANVLFKGDILSKSSRTEMMRAHHLPNGKATPYGLGVRHSSRAGLKLIGHTGLIIGYKAEVFMHPKSGTCVAILANDTIAETRPLAAAIWSFLQAHQGIGN